MTPSFTSGSCRTLCPSRQEADGQPAKRNTMKVVQIGAGSFVFSVSFLHDLILDHRMDGAHIVLVDLNPEALEVMRGVALRFARDAGISITVTCETDRRAALPGADFVVFSAEVQGAHRWMMDFQKLKSAGLADQARENGGLGGLMKTVRSATLIVAVARDMEELCPSASLLITANPLPRLASAVSIHTGIQAIGFCNVAWNGYPGYQWLASIVGKSASEVTVVTAGLNHFAWLVSICDRSTGEDLLPLVVQHIREGQGNDYELLREWYRTYGAVGVSGPMHMGELLPYDPRNHYHDTPPFHGTPEERDRFVTLLKAIGSSEADWRPALAHRSWERPADVATAIYNKTPAHFDMLNIVNNGSLSQLPDDRVVEVPAMASQGVLKGYGLPPLPEPLSSLLNTVSDVIDLSARAAIKGDRDFLRQVVEIDPAIGQKKEALEILDALVDQHVDLAPQFA